MEVSTRKTITAEVGQLKVLIEVEPTETRFKIIDTTPRGRGAREANQITLDLDAMATLADNIHKILELSTR